MHGLGCRVQGFWGVMETDKGFSAYEKCRILHVCIIRGFKGEQRSIQAEGSRVWVQHLKQGKYHIGYGTKPDRDYGEPC